MSFVVKHPLGQAAIDNPVAYPVGLEKGRRCRAADPAAITQRSVNIVLEHDALSLPLRSNQALGYITQRQVRSANLQRLHGSRRVSAAGPAALHAIRADMVGSMYHTKKDRVLEGTQK
jgi:hypothetical protein